MKKQLTSSGNAWYIYLTKTMIQLLNIDPKTSKVIISIEKKSVLINKIEDDEIKNMTNPFVKNIQKVGNGYGIFLTQSVLELIDVDPKIDYVDIEIDKTNLIIKKVAS